ncbi:MAG: C40 family peptidase [Propionibacteriaceae bacterium]|jgi:cell wall-associated NlpC family hydrolase|nr:C40 family peptidase [Propionibacteriaceae bacterium]
MLKRLTGGILAIALTSAWLPAAQADIIDGPRSGWYVSLTATTSTNGVLLSWVPDTGFTATNYTLLEVSYDANWAMVTTTLYSGLGTSYLDTTLPMIGEYPYYQLQATGSYNGKIVTDTVSISSTAPGMTSVAPLISSARLNIGDSLQLTLRSPKDAPNVVTTGSSEKYGNWVSSNPAVVSVDAGGKVTAVGGGTANVTFTSWSGPTATTKVSVAASFDPAYTANATSITPPQTQLKGRDNRIAGTVLSTKSIKGIVLKVLNAKGKVEASVTKKASGTWTSAGYTYDLFKVRAALSFKKLSVGTKTFQVFVKNSAGTALAYSGKFTVKKSIAKSQKALLAAQWAYLRIGDAYSQAKRFQTGYADCSSLVWWAYNQVGISIPKSSKSQAAWMKAKKKTISTSAKLKTGDLLFYDFPKERKGLKYINHVDIYYEIDGVPYIVTAGSGGVKLEYYGYNGKPTIVARLVK